MITVLGIVQEVRTSLDLSSWGGFATYPLQLRLRMLGLPGADATADLVAAGDRMVDHPAFHVRQARSRIQRRLGRHLRQRRGLSHSTDDYRAEVRRCLSRYSPNRPTLVYHQMNSFELPPPEFLRLGRHHNVRLVTTVIDFQELHYPQFFSPEQVAARARNYEVNLGQATAMVTASEFLARKARAIGFDQAPIVVAPLGHEHVPCEHSRAAAPLPRGFDRMKPYIYMPTTPWKHKGHREFLEALNDTVVAVSGSKSHVSVVIPGSVERVKALLGDTQHLGNLRLFLPGYLQASTHYALMEGADVVAFPSMYEGFGLPYLEAGVLSVRLSCFRTEAVQGIYGNLADEFPAPGEYERLAGLTWSQLTGSQSTMSTRAFYETARLFSWESTSQGTLEAYRHAIHA